MNKNHLIWIIEIFLILPIAFSANYANTAPEALAFCSTSHTAANCIKVNDGDNTTEAVSSFSNVIPTFVGINWTRPCGVNIQDITIALRQGDATKVMNVSWFNSSNKN